MAPSRRKSRLVGAIVVAGLVLAGCARSGSVSPTTTRAFASSTSTTRPNTTTTAEPSKRVFSQAFDSPELTITASGTYLSWSTSPLTKGVSTELARVDTANGRILARRNLGAVYFEQAVSAAGSLWVTTSSNIDDSHAETHLLRLNPTTLTLIRRWRFGLSAVGPPWPSRWLAVAGGGLWVAEGDRLLRLSLPSGHLVAAVSVPATANSDVGANGAGSIFIDAYSNKYGTGFLQRRDPVTGRLLATSKPIYGVVTPSIEAVLGSGAWVAEPTGMEGFVGRYDVTTLAPNLEHDFGGSNAISAKTGDGLVWVINPLHPSLCVDPSTGRVLSAVHFPRPDEDVLAAVGSHLLFYAAPGPGGDSYIEQEAIPAGCALHPSTTGEVHWANLAAAGTRLWLFGARACASGTCDVMFRSDNGGRSWARVSAPPTLTNLKDSGVLGHLVFLNRQDGYAYVDGADSLYRTNDGGAHWSHVNVRGAIAAPIVVSRGRVVVLVDRCEATCSSYHLLASAVGSSTWDRWPIPTNMTKGDNASLAAFGSRLWLVTTSQGYGPARLYVSNDVGESFSKVSTTGMQGISCFATAVSATTIWSICNSIHSSSIVRSSDGGRHFVGYGAGFDYFSGSDLCPLSTEEAVVSSTYPSGTTSLAADLEFTTDGGRAFKVIFHRANVLCVALPGSHMWVVLGHGTGVYSLWVTTDQGAHWRRLAVPGGER